MVATTMKSRFTAQQCLYNGMGYSLSLSNSSINFVSYVQTTLLNLLTSNLVLSLPKPLSELLRRIQGCRYIPQRYIIMVMLFLSMSVGYILRVSLNIAITEMVPLGMAEGEKYNNTGNETMVVRINETQGKEVFNWTEKEQGIILSSFYIGYMLLQLPSGSLSDRFGGKYILIFDIFTASIVTAFTPLAARAGFYWMVFLRFLAGFAESGIYPTLFSFMSKWSLPNERSFFCSFVMTGGEFGAIFGVMISGGILELYDAQWAPVFYYASAIGVVLSIFFFFFCYSTPDDHPYISEQEREKLRSMVNPRKALPSTPWLSVLMSVPIWASLSVQLGQTFAILLFLSELSKYLKDILGISTAKNGFLSSLPNIFYVVVSMLSGLISDFIIRKNLLSVINTRKMLVLMGASLACLGLLGVMYSGYEEIYVISSVCISMGSLGISSAGSKPNMMDLTPNYAGSVSGFVNTLCCLGGFAGPYIVGLLVENKTLMEWRAVFWIMISFLMSTTIIFVLFGSSNIQPWDSEQQNELKTDDVEIKNNS